MARTGGEPVGIESFGSRTRDCPFEAAHLPRRSTTPATAASVRWRSDATSGLPRVLRSAFTADDRRRRAQCWRISRGLLAMAQQVRRESLVPAGVNSLQAQRHPGQAVRERRHSAAGLRAVQKAGSYDPVAILSPPCGSSIPRVQSRGRTTTKGERRNNLSAWQGGDRVIPLGDVLVGSELDRGHLGVGDLDAGFVLVGVELGSDLEACASGS